MKIRTLAVLCLSLFVSACVNENDDGSKKSTYSSCKITSSSALFSADRENDLKTCWNAPDDGYESKGDAIQWCEGKVSSYIADRYLFGHSVVYAVESTYCP